MNNNPLEYLEKHAELLQRYNDNQKKIIFKYWDQIRWTRRSGKLADNVVNTEMKYWETFKADDVIKALTIHMNTQQYKMLRENYTRGILRNVSKEESTSASSAPSTVVQANKNKFHNFEQRTSEYTPDQLKEIGREKFIQNLQGTQEEIEARAMKFLEDKKKEKREVNVI